MPTPSLPETPDRPGVGIVGGGAAGLMAAEVLAGAGIAVDLYDAMPSVGRKLLLAGKGGLNLTHSEPHADFVERYAHGRDDVSSWLQTFGPQALRQWAEALGVPTFVGSSGRVFPLDLKAAPLLRAWLHRLRAAGVRFHTRCRWTGWGSNPRALRLQTRDGAVEVGHAAWILALGGASWPQLGSDGRWVVPLEERGVEVAPLRASNCGFDVEGGWSEHFRSRFAGRAVKTVRLRVVDAAAPGFDRKGEFVATAAGIEGSLVYAASAAIQGVLARQGRAAIELDLLPDREAGWVGDELAHPRGARSLSTHLKTRLHLDGIKAALLHECLPRPAFADLPALARGIKALPVMLSAARPIDEAISSAGGVRLDAVDRGLMLKALPGIFCAGEMLDWDAPTGGYLLTASMASGRIAASGVLAWLARAEGESTPD